MGWNSIEEQDEYRERALQWLTLPQMEQDATTWEQARKFVISDTLMMARWQGVSGRTQKNGGSAADALREYLSFYKPDAK